MSNKLKPMRREELRELQPGLWVHDGNKQFCGLRLHRWMTVVRLADSRLFVHSPNTLSTGLQAALAELGQVGCIVAPNRFHSHAMAEYAAAYPDATTFGAPGLRERKPTLRLDRVLGNEPDPEWASDLDQAHVAGNWFMQEVLFLHRASKTLIVTDLVENLHRENVGLGWRVGAQVFGFWQRATPAPEHTLFTLDASAFEQSLEKVRQWEFDRILLAHGRRIEDRAREVFDHVTDDLVRRVRGRGALRRAGCRVLARIQDLLIR